MISLVLFGCLLVLLSLDVPIAFAIGVAGTAAVLAMQRVNLEIIVQRMFYGVDSFLLLAVPLFLLLGEIMQESRITERLVTFAESLIGHVRGGLAHVGIVTNMLMAGISGSGSADAAATGTVLIPAMTRAGYRPAFTAALLGSAATIGPIIPPSIIMIVYASLAGVSVARLFIGGAIPGVIMGLFLMGVVAFLARREDWPRGPRPTLVSIVASTRAALLVLLMPVIIVGGILGGVFTTTESAAIGCAYALLVALVIYRTVGLRQLRGILERSLLGSAKVMFIISASYIFSWILAREGVPAKMAALPVFRDTSKPWLILLTLNVLLLILGCLMEAIAILIIMTPMILPIAAAAGIDLVHLGVVMSVNLTIGLITPPVGMIMYIVCSISKCSIAEFSRQVWPFLAALILLLFLITYVPPLVIALPSALMAGH